MPINFLAAAGAASGLGGAIFSGISGSRSSREARRSRKAATQIAQGGLQFAKEIFNLFRPSIEQLGSFFQETDINDVLAGRVVSPTTQAQISAVNQQFADEDRRINQDLARRGLGDQAAGALISANLRAPRAQIRSNILGAGIQSDLDRRERFATAGANLAGQVGNQFTNVARTLLGNAQSSQRQANLAGQVGGQAFGSALALLPQIFRNREETGN